MLQIAFFIVKNQFLSQISDAITLQVITMKSQWEIKMPICTEILAKYVQKHKLIPNYTYHHYT